MLGAQASFSATRAVVALGGKQSAIPKPLVIPPPNRPKHEPFTRHDYRRALQPPRR